ncbi:MAG TPA: hypothetical protein VF705_07715, partial [Longimicrobium sp.]
MEKRLGLAFLLTAVLIIIWQRFLAPVPPPPARAGAPAAATAPGAAPAAAPAAAVQTPALPPAQQVAVRS